MKAVTEKEVIAQNIFLIRGHKVMLSTHLASLYGVEARSLIQAVKRNIERFPKDFMFQLSSQEFKNLKSQIVISSWGGARRANPYAFTEQGVAMLSSVLRSRRAVQVNIAIMRTFVKLRQILSTHKQLAHKLSLLEHRIEGHDSEIHSIFETIRQLMSVPEKPKRRIGFHGT
ncbi:MAG: DNA-binding protein [Candidatus Omnitrophica bacterium CG11_big_fil_rev_8_21_14_0_20_42_13]|uniref:DNA-binding protein n=1 Tax=Candidatus Ghiorseimicrobium undicola TaxID=1974746 RepID=A0A2H0LUX4_9BACT|nr:MAG: DNA-binding protein [Candidatus Omnitrophica bacterium CG11_big_fil_rev_8_21_14_0_20_42_13]